jgi:ribosomal protein S18 acetylase RimI-like enzyme
MTSAPVTIRAARPADFDALVGLDWSSAVHHAGIDPEFYLVPERALITEFLRRRLSDPDREVLVAEADGAVVGMVDVTLAEDPDPGSIVRPVPTADIGISVLEDWRGRGVGHALMAAAEAAALSRGARRIILDMSSANVGALRFYRSLGYAEYGLLLRRELG